MGPPSAQDVAMRPVNQGPRIEVVRRVHEDAVIAVGRPGRSMAPSEGAERRRGGRCSQEVGAEIETAVVVDGIAQSIELEGRRELTAFVSGSPVETMTTVRYHIPEDVKRAFDEVFRGKNKNAIITDLMRRAIGEEERQAQRARAVDALLSLRAETPPVSAEEVRTAREEVRSWP